MHHLASAAILQRLLEQAPIKSRERDGYIAELLGCQCAMGMIGIRGNFFLEPWRQARYEQGYREAIVRQSIGEATLSPIEVWSLNHES